MSIYLGEIIGIIMSCIFVAFCIFLMIGFLFVDISDPYGKRRKAKEEWSKVDKIEIKISGLDKLFPGCDDNKKDQAGDKKPDAE